MTKPPAARASTALPSLASLFPCSPRAGQQQSAFLLILRSVVLGLRWGRSAPGVRSGCCFLRRRWRRRAWCGRGGRGGLSQGPPRAGAVTGCVLSLPACHPAPSACPLASACRSPPAPHPPRPRRPASPLASAAPRPRSVPPTCPGTQGGTRSDQRGMRTHTYPTKETSWAPSAAAPHMLTSSLLRDKEPRRGWGVTVPWVLCPQP